MNQITPKPFKFVQALNPHASRIYTKEANWELLKDEILKLHRGGHSRPYIKKKIYNDYGVDYSDNQIKYRLEQWKDEIGPRQKPNEQKIPSTRSIPQQMVSTFVIRQSSEMAKPTLNIQTNGDTLIESREEANKQISPGVPEPASCSQNLETGKQASFEEASGPQYPFLNSPQVEVAPHEFHSYENISWSPPTGTSQYNEKSGQDQNNACNEADEALYSQTLESLESLCIKSNGRFEECLNFEGPTFSPSQLQTDSQLPRVELALSLVIEDVKNPDTIQVITLQAPNVLIFLRSRRSNSEDHTDDIQQAPTVIGVMYDLSLIDEKKQFWTSVAQARIFILRPEPIECLSLISQLLISWATYFQEDYGALIELCRLIVMAADYIHSSTISQKAIELLSIGVRRCMLGPEVFPPNTPFALPESMDPQAHDVQFRLLLNVFQHFKKVLDPKSSGILLIGSKLINLCLNALRKNRSLVGHQNLAIETVGWCWNQLYYRLTSDVDIWKDIGASQFIWVCLRATELLKMRLPFERFLDLMVELYDKSSVGSVDIFGLSEGARALGELLGASGDYRRAIYYTHRFIQISMAIDEAPQLAESDQVSGGFLMPSLQLVLIRPRVLDQYKSMKLLGELIMKRGAVRYAALIFRLTYRDMMRFKALKQIKENAQEVWSLYQRCLEASKNSGIDASNNPNYRFIESIDNRSRRTRNLRDTRLVYETTHDSKTDVMHPKPLRLNSQATSLADFFDPGFQRFLADVCSHEDPISYFTTFRDTPSPNITLQ
ncbi:hypothetical protein TWF694_009259 [Orbilia ellipsospora]|uniref:Clr5 domain-containing protein n=1 Tax=Orbilia ellipsospora TaxID=2528407 RepID=A0AAV9XFC9_9PEZI